jgi:diadenosine tetraphosphatase ApaH/serine/threonine PP2A family protein phosphatase
VIGYHGTPGNDEGWLTKTTSDAEIASLFAQQTAGRLGLGGHTHEPMDRSWQGWRLINVGSVGAPRAGGAEYGMLTFAGGAVRVELLTVPFDAEAVASDIDRIGTPSAAWMKRKMHLSKESRRG